ncbi:MAG: Phosphoserine phosphatase RsbU [Syntrophorhabdus sp. PtaB.Bin047]|jgi:sigma-B regulation protein RsbU (phosphoserine phosphatase)|nr:MAG: Phosphoserine phosphatase RsbU [Syntrophorhabdus sp. PtaB.Bin047]
MFKNKGIAFKLVLFFTLSSAAIFAAIFSYNYLVSRRMIQKGIEENSANLITTTTSRIEVLLTSTQKVPQNTAYLLENTNYDEAELFKVIYAIVEKNPEIYGAAVAFEPYAFDRTKKYFAPYFYRNGEGISFKYLDRFYDYFHWDWYQIPRELEQPQWTEPYFGEGGGILMSSYAVPFYRVVDGTRRLTGVVVVDISLEELRKIVSSIRILKSGYGFLISKNGTFVTHPIKELIMNETIFSVAEERKDPMLRDTGRRMIRGETGYSAGSVKSAVTGKNCIMTYVPIKSNGWSLGVLFPHDELMADITNLNHVVLALGIGGLMLLALAVVFIARSITRPLTEMADIAGRIGTGDLEAHVPEVRTRDEVGKLASALDCMKTSLKDYIREITDTTAARQRMESELKIARNIQMGILPKEFPPFPDRTDFDIHALTVPAREVGGDFYDFFLIDREHLCIVIGDASGKGIPAALFMAFTKTLIKARASADIETGVLMGEVNDELSKGNPADMFITVFCAILNTATGELRYTNGGHNPPVIIRHAGNLSYLDGPGELVVGIMDGTQYTTRTLTLNPGDGLFLYTDGVTEAMNAAGEIFSTDRLKDVLATCAGGDVSGITACVGGAINDFCKDAPQYDDITMMAVRYDGPGDGNG